ncbi:MAG: D-amino acid aminotransferase [Methylococcales bacterium]|nr:D-amino acid aminotransferase [Methylococcales bacterium]
MEDNLVYLNGDYLPLSEAKISVLDRGFLFGDGVYEVIPVYTGRLFHLEDHLERLNASLSQIRLELTYDLAQWTAIFEPLLESTKDQFIYLQITRGVAAKRDHAFPEHITPTIFVMCSDLIPFAGVKTGVKALTIDDNRWEMCHVKATTLLANILLRQEAVEKGCTEAILVKEGYITEGAASNLFIVVDGILITPRKNNDILSGITRDVILELAKRNGIEVNEEVIALEVLATATEIWVTSSTREIVPVVELDEQPVGDGEIGAVFKHMYQLFQDYKQSL